jgi:DNA polymerase-3 subunit delta'
MWSNVIGQSRVKRILQTALEHEKLPGAYLFSGPEGTGKDATAIELAKVVNCLAPLQNGTEACEQCANCLSIASLASPIVTFVHALARDIESPGESNQKAEDLEAIREQIAAKAADPYHDIEIPRATSIQIGQIRELRLALSRSLSGGTKRVVILSEADMMNVQAQNAFLKSLEEPHANTLLILTSSNPSRLLPTIASRCQDIRFDILPAAEIEQALIEREELPSAQAGFLARLSAGSYSQARSLIGEDVQEMRNQIVDFLRRGLTGRRLDASRQIDVFLPRTGGGVYLEKRQAVEQRLTLLTLWLRDALALSTQANDEEIINLDQKKELSSFVAKFGDPEKIVQAIHHIERAQSLTRLQLQLRPVMLQLVGDLETALK